MPLMGKDAPMLWAGVLPTRIEVSDSATTEVFYLVTEQGAILHERPVVNNDTKGEDKKQGAKPFCKGFNNNNVTCNSQVAHIQHFN
jgi:hypothetical protein